MPFFPIAAIMGIVIALLASRYKQANAAWAAAARRLGLVLKPSGGFGGLTGRLSMSGTTSGYAVTIDTHSSNDNQHTRFRVRIPPLGLGLRVSRQTALSSLAGFFGSQDIEVGEAVFDKAVVVKGNYTPRVQAFLTPARRVAITELILAYPQAKVTDEFISYSKKGLVTDPDQLVSILERLLSVAEQLSSPGVTLNRVTDRRLEGDPGEALEDLKSSVRRRDPWEEFALKTQEAELSYVNGDLERAAQAFEDLARQVPADPEVRSWKEKTRRQLKEPDRPKLEGDAGPAQEVADRLFHSDLFSFETVDLFEGEYQGKSVRWSGQLQRLRHFDHDRDFGDGPGVKAVFRIATVENDLFAGREVDAVVRLPAGARDQVEVGETYDFSGTLSRCDPTMRNLYIQDAEIT